MIREHWRDPQFRSWFWRSRVPLEAKVGTLVCVLGALSAGGYFASGWLSGASAAGGGSHSYALETTVTKVVTVRRHGQTVVKRVPVVIRRSLVRSGTASSTLPQTQVVTAPGGTRYVTRRVVHVVPVVRQRVIRVNGKTTTVTETHLVPTVKTETLTNVVTNQQTVTNASTVVVNHTETIVQPVTNVETRTVTSPPQTVTVSQTETRTVVSTVTVPEVTITVTTITLGGNSGDSP